MSKNKNKINEKNVQASENGKAEIEVGEQMELIDVGPENLKEIEPHVKKLDVARSKRIAALKVEHEEEEKIKQLVHKSGLKRLSDGNIKFRCAGREVWIMPTDEKVKLKKINDE